MKTPHPLNLWERTTNHLGERRTVGLAWILFVGIAALAIRLLSQYEIDHTALLYVGIPYFISLVIMLVRPLGTPATWRQRYVSHSATALTVFLASSVVLMEGFVCVIYFLPIYFGVVTLSFIVHWIAEIYQRRKGRTYASVIPLLFFAVSLEGITPALTVDRANVVTVTAITQKSSAQVLKNLAMPIDLKTERHWILSIFPMPYEVASEAFNVGAVHTVRTRYHRWFVTNTHEGELQLEITRLDDDAVDVRFFNDSTFFSNYIQLDRSEIELLRLDSGSTEVRLHIHFQRKLDPAWYFQPLQRYAVTQMGELLIDEVIIRE